MKDLAKSGWVDCTLGDVLALVRNGLNCKQNKDGVGAAISRIETIATGEFNLERIGYSEISKQDREKFLLRRGDILFSHINSPPHIGKSAVLHEDADLIHGVNLLLFRPFEKVDPYFLQLFLNTLYVSGYWRGMCKQSVNQASVNQKDIKKVPFSYPPLEEQQRIVAVLDEAFEGLARARTHAEANLQNARELFESYLAAAFLGEEAGWEVCELNEHVRFIDYRGKTPPKTESGIRLITAKNVKMGYIQREPEEFILESAYEGWMTRGFPKLGDVLFTTEAPLANVAQLDTEETVVIGQRLITMQADQEVILPEFLKFSLMSPPMQSEIHTRGTGATVVGIKAKLLKTVPLRFPRNLDRQRTIAANCQSAYDNMERLEETFRSKLQDIDDLRQSLLQKAFAGELT
ncbi:restriction endonuclease subunit S [Salipiger sp.]|uniref:restriction endonuclease subunit S n=1 Tax=Salipiger sp. TaxID=2078585 RepID=UPI003A98851A